MKKKGQLAIIEFKDIVIGFLVGLAVSLVLVFLGSKNIVPFKIPFVCGSAITGLISQKKGQLGIIQFKFFMMGFFFGLIAGWVLVFLGTANILPFQIPFVCNAPVVPA